MARAHAFSSAAWGTSIRNLAIAGNLLSLIPLSARVCCSLGARPPFPVSSRITFRQAADVAVFERPLGPQDDHGRLFAVGRHRGDVVVFPGDMDDPEIDFWFGDPRAGSNTDTLGEPAHPIRASLFGGPAFFLPPGTCPP